MLKTAQVLRSLLLILITTVITTVAQSIQFLRLALSSRAALSAEVLFLRKQLAFYQEHQIPARTLTAVARVSLVLWSRFFHWREALMIVKPEILIGWHRNGFKLWWRWKSRLGRPRNLRTILREWVAHQGRPHSSLGPGIPDLHGRPIRRPKAQGHELPAACRIRVKDILGGLHHEYWLEEIAA